MARNRSPSPTDLISRHSASPPPLPQSKRDKRRTMLSDKLNDMIASFNANLRPHYEAQASAIQVDISLIHRADPYQTKPLEDDPEEIGNLVRSAVGGKIPTDPVAEADFVAGAGKLYTEFVHEVNDAMEERDINLTLLHNKHQSTISELEQRYQFHVRMAHEEHRLLSNTIRERLVNQLSKRKERLLKEKDMLDIGDSNALLLNPNQFSIANPASPGGAHKRSTRNTGRRGVDPDDPASIAQESKRKRQRLFEEVEGQSPAPGPSKSIEFGAGSPFRDAKAKTVWHQQEAPAYSIDRLFTEKELTMTMNNAAIAAQHFLLKQQNQMNGQMNGNGVNGSHTEIDEGANSGAATGNEADMDDDATPAAPEMDRTVSQSHHATRGTTRALAGLAAVATGDIPLGTLVPTYIPAVMGAKANSAPVTAAPLSAAEVEHDLQLMMRDTGGDDPTNDRLLERSTGPQPAAEYQYKPPSLLNENQEGPPTSLFPSLGAVGGVSMSRQSSQAGYSEAPAMSRSNSMRGVGMQRTASNTGSVLLGGPDGGRVGVRRRLV